MNLISILPLLKFKVKEKSMIPLLNPEDEVIVWKLSKLKIGDIAVLKKNKKFYIKRVSKIKDDSTSSRFRGASKYFLEGDNEKESIDSRKFGWVFKKDIIGKAIYRI